MCGRGMRPCSRTDMLAYAGVQLADVQSKQLVAMAYRKLINVKSLQNLKSIDLFTGAKKTKRYFLKGSHNLLINIINLELLPLDDPGKTSESIDN